MQFVSYPLWFRRAEYEALMKTKNLCKQKYSGDLNLVRRFEEMWTYHAEGFEDGRKILKQVKKCNTLVKYEAVLFKAINELV